jgi:predicted O-methyltransferase YrrM
MKSFTFLFFLLSYCVIYSADSLLSPEKQLPTPYQELKQLHSFDPHGWYINGSKIKELIETRHVKTIIEVGCWLGASTRHMASLLPPDGKVYAIDHWQGSIEHQPGQSHFLPVLDHLYEQFLSNVIHEKLTHKIVPLRMNSLNAAQFLKNSDYLSEKPDLIYIDASHDYESVYADIKAWYPLVEGHGVICGDDWHHPPIVEAVRTFAQENGLSIEIGDNCWVLIDPLQSCFN